MDELTNCVLSLHEEAEADRIAIAELRLESVAQTRETLALIDENSRQIAALARHAGTALQTLKTTSKAHTEGPDAILRIQTRHEQSITEIRGNQKLTGKAIQELPLTQASMFEAMKRPAASVSK